MIAARASGAREAYVYIRHEYPLAFERMKAAVKQAESAGLLGTNILGLGWDFDVISVLGAGSYVCGDETGLINSIDGYRGMPRIKPPFPAQAGLWNKPTNVNNVESYANAPLILRNGAAWWCNVNPEGQPEKGTKMFSLSGQIRWPGCFEVPFGSGTVRNMLDQYGGGMREGSVIKGYQPGGPLSGILPASDLDLPAQLGPFRERGMFFGGGGICFFDQNTSILDLALWMTGFCEDESCGRCTTCHGGTQRAVETLRRIAAGGGSRHGPRQAHGPRPDAPLVELPARSAFAHRLEDSDKVLPPRIRIAHPRQDRRHSLAPRLHQVRREVAG